MTIDLSAVSVKNTEFTSERLEQHSSVVLLVIVKIEARRNVIRENADYVASLILGGIGMEKILSSVYGKDDIY